jgi:short-subunit dehydrogenase
MAADANVIKIFPDMVYSQKQLNLRVLWRIYMKDLKKKYGNWCLVAGAAEGIGKEFAASAAGNGMDLLLVDHQEEALLELGTYLENKYSVTVRLLVADLADAESVTSILAEIQETGCRLFIYNAAFSRVKPFVENDAAELDRYVAVNVSTLLQLLHGFASHHKHQPQLSKGIILMSSLAGSWGSRLLAPYGATKAFTRILAEALHRELKDTGFDILVSITGATATPGYLSSLPGNRKPPGGVMHPQKVVDSCFRGLGKKTIVIPGYRNKVAHFILSRILPRRLSAGIMNHQVGRLYRN